MTDWQNEQNEILDRIEKRIKTLPRRVSGDLLCGTYRECRHLVEMLDMPKNPGSSHDVTEVTIRELDAEFAQLVPDDEFQAALDKLRRWGDPESGFVDTEALRVVLSRLAP
jgi:hypothetical protein